MPGRARVLSMIAAVALLLPATATIAPATATIVVPPSVTTKGAAWYAVTLDLRPKARVEFQMSWRMAGRFSATGCFGFVRRQSGDDLAGQALWVGAPGKTAARVVADPTAAAGLPLDPIGTGTQDTMPVHAGASPACRSTTVHAGPRAIESFLFFIAGDGAIDRASIRLKPGLGIAVLAQARGRRTQLLREWSFSSALHGRVVPELRCETLAVVRGTRHTAFARRAAVVFETGSSQPGVPAGVGQVGDVPAVLSSRGPTSPTAATANGTSLAAWMRFVGESGTYSFGIEAIAAPYCRIAETPLGKAPYVVLATADADFPACSTPPVRVVARARDGHPVCG